VPPTWVEQIFRRRAAWAATTGWQAWYETKQAIAEFASRRQRLYKALRGISMSYDKLIAVCHPLRESITHLDKNRMIGFSSMQAGGSQSFGDVASVVAACVLGSSWLLRRVDDDHSHRGLSGELEP